MMAAVGADSRTDTPVDVLNPLHWNTSEQFVRVRVVFHEAFTIVHCTFDVESNLFSIQLNAMHAAHRIANHHQWRDSMELLLIILVVLLVFGGGGYYGRGRGYW
jgi:hypothetical protein